jgi:rubrerythrin
MKGGFDAWTGRASRSEVDQGLYIIEGNESPQELLSLAYGLEEGNQCFYMRLAEQMGDDEIKNLFSTLAAYEEKHKESIWQRYASMTKKSINRQSFEQDIVPAVMEQGKTADEILNQYYRWFPTVSDVMEFAMSLETDALDLYLRMAGKTRDEASKKIFFALSEEERSHLKILGEAFQETISP